MSEHSLAFESLREPSFEEWVTAIFDHPVQKPAWHWDDWPQALLSSTPSSDLAFMTRLFREPESLLSRFTASQIDQGLAFIVSASEMCHALTDEDLPLDDRLGCIHAMIPLYTKLMAPIYGDTLGHLSQSAPGGACYMWWDAIPFYGGMPVRNLDALNEAVLDVLKAVLLLDAEACLESALHGLGHWHLYIPDRTTPIARHFLRRTDISDSLRKYGEDAAIGGVQ